MTASKNPKLRFKDENGKDFPNWRNIRLEDLLDYEQPSKYIVKNTDYSNEYITPVLTAGKSFILGYTNENNGIFNKEKLPVIIFDDFTTAFKLVNFPFKVKSSAIKILHNKSDKNSNIRFVFNRMLGINFKLGDEHKRYWISEYSKLEINIPNIDEQEKIAEFLTSVDNYIQNLKSQKEELERYKKAVMQKIFSQQLRFKDSNGKDFPNWDNKKIEEIFRVTRGNVLSVNKMKSVKDAIYNYPVYSSQTLKNGLIGYYDKYLFENSITWTTDGANAGDVNFRSGKFYCTNVCGVLTNNPDYTNVCVSEILNSVAKRYVSYVGNPKLMNNVMSKIKINLPHPEEQKRISYFLDSIENLVEIKSKEIENAEYWKKGLMQQMFI